MILTMRDRIALATLQRNGAEREVAESAVYLVARFHESAVTREEVLGWTLEQTVEAVKEILPRMAEAAKNGAAANEILGKLH